MLTVLLALALAAATPLTAPAGLVAAPAGALRLTGACPAGAQVQVRVLADRGAVTDLAATAIGQTWSVDYPSPPAGGWLALTVRAGDLTAESLLILAAPGGALPDLPSAFTTDLLDAAGRTDASCAKWPAVRAAVNSYLRSRGAQLAGVGRADFDLARPADMAWWRDHLALYDFRHRDRDWSTPLDHRPGRTFWNSVWRTWFNPTNDHPLDGNPNNHAASNYCPYAFSNDFADLLIAHTLKRRANRPLDDNLAGQLREATENLLAMQHREASNFSLRDSRGIQHHYTEGAFRYGLFETGEWLTEGKGWFYNPAFHDYDAGGVLNGRCLWACGESLLADPDGPLAGRLREAIALGARFCLRDALADGYAKRTAGGRVYWRDAGEHAYLALGLVQAARVAPELRLDLAPSATLRATAESALDALVDLCRPEHQWSVYPNVDSMAVVALARGALSLPDSPGAERWRRTAREVTTAWLSAKVPDYPATPLHFGPRLKADQMTYNWGHLSGHPERGRNTIYLYQTGHWLQALALVARLEGGGPSRDRALALVRYLCGDNPWRVRLLTELGGVYNWVDDQDGDGLEDTVKMDLYPESTAFCQIGLLELLAALPPA